MLSQQQSAHMDQQQQGCTTTFQLHRYLAWAVHGIVQLDAALGAMYSALHR